MDATGAPDESDVFLKAALNVDGFQVWSESTGWTDLSEAWERLEQEDQDDVKEVALAYLDSNLSDTGTEFKHDDDEVFY